jgi:hypothetical protein
MAEQQIPHTNGVNGVNGDVHMADPDDHTPATTPGVNDILSTSQIDLNDSSAYTTPNVDLEDDQPPPAKRARVHSDADKASIAHVSLEFAVPRRANELHPKVSNSTSSFHRYFQRCNTCTSSNIHSRPLNFQPTPISFLSICTSHPKKTKGCSPISSAS